MKRTSKRPAKGKSKGSAAMITAVAATPMPRLLASHVLYVDPTTGAELTLDEVDHGGGALTVRLRDRRAVPTPTLSIPREAVGALVVALQGLR